jgi:hypothetical protein
VAIGSKGTSRDVRRRGASFLNPPGRGPIVRRGVRVSLVVGTILTIINEGPTVVGGHGELSLVPRALLNYVVPFCVSCYSALATRRGPPGEPTADGEESLTLSRVSHTSVLGEESTAEDEVR